MRVALSLKRIDTPAWVKWVNGLITITMIATAILILSITDEGGILQRLVGALVAGVILWLNSIRYFHLAPSQMIPIDDEELVEIRNHIKNKLQDEADREGVGVEIEHE